jgi:hypothetical protein
MQGNGELDPSAARRLQPAGCPPLETEVKLPLDLGAAKQAAHEASASLVPSLSLRPSTRANCERVDPGDSVGDAPIRLQARPTVALVATAESSPPDIEDVEGPRVLVAVEAGLEPNR